MPSTEQSSGEDAQEDGLIKTAMTVVTLGCVAVFVLGPEYLRMAACRLLGKEYKPPTQRMVEDVDELAHRD